MKNFILVISKRPEFLAECLSCIRPISGELMVAQSVETASVLVNHFNFQAVVFEALPAHGMAPDSADIVGRLLEINPKLRTIFVEDVTNQASPEFHSKVAQIANLNVPSDVDLIKTNIEGLRVAA